MNFRTFFDRKRGKDIAIGEFPFLFIMQSHTGASGIIFSAIWFVILLVQYPGYWNAYTIGFAAVVGSGFLLMIVLSNIFAQKIVDRDLDDNRTADDWDYYARRSMAILMVLFALVCSTLIGATGGMSSPFIPFYVMVYTIALTKCALPHPGRALLVLYLLPFFFAGLIAHKWLPLAVNPQTIDAIKQGSSKEYVDFVFAMASMVVPYLSSLYVESRERRRMKHGATSAVPAPSSPKIHDTPQSSDA